MGKTNQGRAFCLLMAYGFLPLVALDYLVGNLRALIIDKSELTLTSYLSLNFLLILLFVITSVLWIKEKASGTIVMAISCVLAMFKFAWYVILDVQEGEPAWILEDAVYLVLFLILFILNLVYNKKKKPAVAEETLAVAEGVVAEETLAAEADVVEDLVETAETATLESFEGKAIKDSTKKESRIPYFLKSFLVVIMVFLVVDYTYNICGYIRNLIEYTIFQLMPDSSSISMLKQQNIYRITYALGDFLELFFGIWLAFAVNKSQIVTYKDLGLEKSKKPVKSILMGGVFTLIIILGASLTLKIMGCGFSVNKILPRIVFVMSMSVIMYIGVAVFEEVVSRGVILGYCEKHKLPIWGTVVSSVFFVGIHFVTGAYTKPTAIIFLGAGAILYCALKRYSSNLFVGIGYHFFYDWAVTHLVEIRTVNNKESFISVLKLTFMKQALCIAIPSLIVALALYILAYRKRKEIA